MNEHSMHRKGGNQGGRRRAWMPLVEGLESRVMLSAVNPLLLFANSLRMVSPTGINVHVHGPAHTENVPSKPTTQTAPAQVTQINIKVPMNQVIPISASVPPKRFSGPIKLVTPTDTIFLTLSPEMQEIENIEATAPLDKFGNSKVSFHSWTVAVLLAANPGVPASQVLEKYMTLPHNPTVNESGQLLFTAWMKGPVTANVVEAVTATGAKVAGDPYITNAFPGFEMMSFYANADQLRQLVQIEQIGQVFLPFGAVSNRVSGGVVR